AGGSARQRGAPAFGGRAPPLGSGNPGSLREASDGSVWGASFVDGPVLLADTSGRSPPDAARRTGIATGAGARGARTMLLDDGGDLWLAENDGGVRWRAHSPTSAHRAAPGSVDVETFARADGLSA